MYKELIKSYIPKLTPRMIKDYGETINISLTDSEFIMKNYSEILEGNETSFIELKRKLNPNLYQQLLNLYNENKNKYL